MGTFLTCVTFRPNDSDGSNPVGCDRSRKLADRLRHFCLFASIIAMMPTSLSARPPGRVAGTGARRSGGLAHALWVSIVALDHLFHELAGRARCPPRRARGRSGFELALAREVLDARLGAVAHEAGRHAKDARDRRRAPSRARRRADSRLSSRAMSFLPSCVSTGAAAARRRRAARAARRSPPRPSSWRTRGSRSSSRRRRAAFSMRALVRRRL